MALKCKRDHAVETHQHEEHLCKSHPWTFNLRGKCGTVFLDSSANDFAWRLPKMHHCARFRSRSPITQRRKYFKATYARRIPCIMRTLRIRTRSRARVNCYAERRTCWHQNKVWVSYCGYWKRFSSAKARALRSLDLQAQCRRIHINLPAQSLVPIACQDKLQY